MGLLNNDNYIDPFKGADYIDPGKNAEKLSSNVDREHAQREAYEQQRYAKQQQTPQRTPTPPQEPRHTPQQALVNRQTPISRTTRTRKSRIPIIIIAIAVLTIIAMNLVGTIVSHGGLDSIADRLDPTPKNMSSSPNRRPSTKPAAICTHTVGWRSPSPSRTWKSDQLTSTDSRR